MVRMKKQYKVVEMISHRTVKPSATSSFVFRSILKITANASQTGLWIDRAELGYLVTVAYYFVPKCADLRQRIAFQKERNLLKTLRINRHTTQLIN